MGCVKSNRHALMFLIHRSSIADVLYIGQRQPIIEKNFKVTKLTNTDRATIIPVLRRNDPLPDFSEM